MMIAYFLLHKTSNHHFPSNIYINCFIIYKNHIRSTKKKSELSSFRILRLKTGIFPYKEQEFGILLKGQFGSLERGAWGGGAEGKQALKAEEGNGTASEKKRET